MTKLYLAISYAIAIAFLAIAFWLTQDWHWAVRLPLLGYLALCSFVFPLSRIPADIVVAYTTAWSPVEIYGLLVWAALAVFYGVVWALGILFAPIGALLHWSRKRALPAPGENGAL